MMIEQQEVPRSICRFTEDELRPIREIADKLGVEVIVRRLSDDELARRFFQKGRKCVVRWRGRDYAAEISYALVGTYPSIHTELSDGRIVNWTYNCVHLHLGLFPKNYYETPAYKGAPLQYVGYSYQHTEAQAKAAGAKVAEFSITFPEWPWEPATRWK